MANSIKKLDLMRADSMHCLSVLLVFSIIPPTFFFAFPSALFLLLLIFFELFNFFHLFLQLWILGKCWWCPFMLDLLLIKRIWHLLILLGAHLKLPDTARARIFGKVQNLKGFCRNLRVQGPFQYFIEDFLGTVLIKFDWSLSFLQKLIVLWIFYIEVAFFHIIILICFH